MSSKKALHESLQPLQTNSSADYPFHSSTQLSSTHSSLSNRLILSPQKEIIKLPVNTQVVKRTPKSIEQGGDLYRKIQYNLNTQSTEKTRTPSGEKLKTLARIYAESPAKTPILRKIFKFHSNAKDKKGEQKGLVRSYENIDFHACFKASRSPGAEKSAGNNISVPFIRTEKGNHKLLDTSGHDLEKYIFPKLEDLKKREGQSELKYFYGLRKLFYQTMGPALGREGIYQTLFKELEELFIKLIHKVYQLQKAHKQKPVEAIKQIHPPEQSFAAVRERLDDCLKTLSLIKTSNLPIDKIFDQPLSEKIDRLISNEPGLGILSEGQEGKRATQNQREKSPFKLNLDLLKSAENSKEKPADFQQEFWAKIEEFSQSWRDAGERERKI